MKGRVHGSGIAPTCTSFPREFTPSSGLLFLIVFSFGDDFWSSGKLVC